MPSTRKRTRRGSALTDLVIAQIGVGTGINHLADDELRQLWREHGAEVDALWRRRYGPTEETFVGWLARAEGWPDSPSLETEK